MPGDQRTLDRLAALVAEYEPAIVFVGLPISLRGRHELAAQKVLGHVEALASRIPCPVRLLDERLTTVTASRQLHEAGRSAKRQRAVIDQAAAVGILQHAIDAATTQGSLPGTVFLPSSQGCQSAPTGEEDPE